MSPAVSPRQLSFAEALTSYPSRNPAGTILYKVVQENLETFIQETESNPNSKGLPEYVKRDRIAPVLPDGAHGEASRPGTASQNSWHTLSWPVRPSLKEQIKNRIGRQKKRNRTYRFPFGQGKK